MTSDATRDPFRALQEATRVHRREHGCGAYTFEDGPGLAALAAHRRPRHILELGTALGYTACCLASGAPEAKVDTIERDAIHVALARRHIAQAGLTERVTVHAGAFSQALEALPGPYDLIFFDGFAPDASVLETLGARLSAQGVLVCANLALADAAERNRLRLKLSDPRTWRALPALEDGATEVWLKL